MTAWTDITALEFVDDGTAYHIEVTDYNSLYNNIRNVHERTFALEALLPGGIPLGGACLWYGIVANLPVGWVLCDGLNNTLNMLDRFVMGAAADGEVAEKGGAVTHLHDGPDTNTSASHSHTSVFETGNASGAGFLQIAGVWITLLAHHHHYSLSTAAGGSHSHGFGKTGSSNVLPPYKRLYWITRTVS